MGKTINQQAELSPYLTQEVHKVAVLNTLQAMMDELNAEADRLEARRGREAMNASMALQSMAYGLLNARREVQERMEKFAD